MKRHYARPSLSCADQRRYRTRTEIGNGALWCDATDARMRNNKVDTSTTTTPNTFALAWLRNTSLKIDSRPFSTALDRKSEISGVPVSKRKVRRLVLDVRGSSRMRGSCELARVGLRGPRSTPSFCRATLSHGSLHVCDAFRGNRPRGAQRACGASVHHCVKTSSPRYIVRSELFACARCGSCPRAG